MSIRINKAIGYGLSYDDFVKYCPLLSDVKRQDVHDVLETASEFYGEITRPDTGEYAKYALGDECKPLSPIITKEQSDAHKTILDLISMVGPDDCTDVIFYPSVYYEKNWHHRDDDVDYAFERWHGPDTTRDNDGRLTNEVKYVSWGHYPFSNNLMDLNGNTVEWDIWNNFADKEDVVFPRPPSEIVYWTQLTNILSREGVMKLRPVLARWWV